MAGLCLEGRQVFLSLYPCIPIYICALLHPPSASPWISACASVARSISASPAMFQSVSSPTQPPFLDLLLCLVLRFRPVVKEAGGSLMFPYFEDRRSSFSFSSFLLLSLPLFFFVSLFSPCSYSKSSYMQLRLSTSSSWKVYRGADIVCMYAFLYACMFVCLSWLLFSLSFLQPIQE